MTTPTSPTATSCAAAPTSATAAGRIHRCGTATSFVVWTFRIPAS